MAASDFERLNSLLLDALMHSRTERALLQQNTRTGLLAQRGFSREAVRVLSTIGDTDLTSFARQAQTLLENLPSEKGDDAVALEVTTRLLERGFSREFIDMFERILTKSIGQPAQDAFVVHFSSEIRLEEAAQIARELDQLYQTFVYANYPDQFVRLSEDMDRRYVEVRELRRGSLELFFMAQLLNDPIIQGVFVNGLYDVIKTMLGNAYRHIMVRRNNEGISIEPQTSDSAIRSAQIVPSAAFEDQTGEFVERRIRRERFFGFGRTKLLVFGTEQIETERRVTY